MIKTVKIKKKLRLDELIKYIFDNEVTLKDFCSLSREITVHVSNIGGVRFDIEESSTVRFIHDHNIFTVEEEEEITEDTVFDTLVDVNNNDEVHTTRNVSIGLYAKEQTKEIHALVNGKLQLIWEAE